MFFARGAVCMLTKRLETTLGLGKGSTSILLDAVWEDKTLAVDVDALQAGSITVVSQSDFLSTKYLSTEMSLEMFASDQSLEHLSMKAKSEDIKDMNVI